MGVFCNTTLSYRRNIEDQEKEIYLSVRYNFYCKCPKKSNSLKLGHKCLDLSNKMKKTRFTETQIVRALKEGEEGRKTEDICRELEISKATFYNWKSRYGGMEASDVKRLKELEEENARLKKMFAELSMNHDILKEVITKKGWGSGSKNS